MGYDGNGKRIVKNETFHPTAKSENAQRKQAESYAAELERKVKQGELYNIAELTLNEYFNQWKTDIAPLTLTQSKQESYQYTMKKYFIPAIGFMNISTINPMHLQAIVSEMIKQGLKPKSIKTYFSVISSIMGSAVKKRIIKENPCARLTFPKNEKKVVETVHAFTIQQSQIFLKALEDNYTVVWSERKRKNAEGEMYDVSGYEQTISISPMWKAYFNLALYSGVRRGEACALRWSDIDFETMTVSITKASAITSDGQVLKDTKTVSSRRELLLPLPVFVKLREWKTAQEKHAAEIGSEWKETGFVFTQADGRQINLYTPSHKLHEIIELHNRTASENEKLPNIRLHDLRHCTASLLIASGADIATISRMLGHSRISTTLDIYTHSLRKNDETISNKLAELLTIEEANSTNEAAMMA
ncbi:MAG: site-specific integrase [Solobacterium sp.]|nr:site-specific integrase [Solobacterium sp.]